MKAISSIIAPIAALLLATSGAALAAESPAPGPLDPRIRTVRFEEDQVVQLTGFLGYQMMLEFGAGERIENVSVGDALGWQITPNKKADLLFLKPLEHSSPTNMTVVTNRRRYAFELQPAGPEASLADVAYVVRFTYPQDAQAAAPPPAPDAPPAQARNASYAYTGARETLPGEVFDDGASTYFSFLQGASLPAIFVVGTDGEALANYMVRGRYIVVDQVAAHWVLRSGKAMTTVINTAYQSPLAGADAPRPADRKTAKLARAAIRSGERP